MKKLNNTDAFHRTSLFRKITSSNSWEITPNSISGTPREIKQTKIKPKSNKKNTKPPKPTYVKNSDGENVPVYIVGPELQAELFDLETITPSEFYSFNNTTLGALPSGSPVQFPTSAHWTCDIKFENNGVGRIYIENVKIREQMQMGGTGSHIHEHDVFKSIHFQDVVVEFEIQGVVIEKRLDINYSEIVPNMVQVQYRYLGKNDFENAQAGICQTNDYYFYCANTLIHLQVEFSFVFCYPKNDFEPTGVIDACKIFPQIQFYYHKQKVVNAQTVYANTANFFPIEVPSGKNGDKVRIKKIYARTKMTCNNNNANHISIDAEGYDINYFKDLTDIPPLFKKKFDSNKMQSNTVGFYTDSNTGTTTPTGNSDPRDKPKYELATSNLRRSSQPAPFWSNIFDYGTYNFSQSYEFEAVNNKPEKRYANGGIYPAGYSNTVLGTPKSISIAKEPRQGAFDNIHFHGYLGYYMDNNQPVIHAPICGYCCFHLHWRWSGLNHELVNDPFLAFGSGQYQEALKRFGPGEEKKYLGWGKKVGDSSQEVPSVTKGGPLIPQDQVLRIALTAENHTVANKTNNVVTNGTQHYLPENEKTIWYCLAITNGFDADEGQHLSMEQGCGYAFRYSDIGDSVKNIKAPNVTLATQPSPTPNYPYPVSYPETDFISFPRIFREILVDQANLFHVELGSHSDFLDYVYNYNTEATSLTTTEYYEMQYRFMRFFNETVGNATLNNRRNINQIPVINMNPNVDDPNTLTNFGSILNTFRDL